MKQSKVHFRINAAVFLTGVLSPTSSQTQAQIPCQYEVAAIIQGPDCQFAGPTGAFGAGISPNGRYVCGRYAQCEIGDKAFLYDTQTQQFTTLPFPAGVVSMTAADVNDSAIVVGQIEHAPSGQYQGFMWNSQTGQFTILLPHPGGAWAGVNAVNNSSVVCGFRSIGPGVNPWEAFIWSAETGYTNLGLINGQRTAAIDINENSQVCGWTGSQLNPLSFINSRGQYTIFGPVPGGSNCSPNRMNNVGDVVVGGSPGVACRWNAGFEVLPPLDARFNLCGALGINDSRGIVGSCRNSANVRKPVVWVNAVPQDLHQLTPEIPALTIVYANGISENWMILEGGYYNGNDAAVVLQPQFPIPGDTDCNSVVNIDDLVHVIVAWGSCIGCRADLNGDQTTNIDDLVLVITNWTLTP